MKPIIDYMAENMVVELTGCDKIEALKKLMDSVITNQLLTDPDAFFEKIIEREKQSSTAIGLGVAIPHARMQGLDKIFIAVGRSIDGIDFTTPDGTPVHLIFLIGVNYNQSEYLKILSRISWLIRNDNFRKKLFSVNSVSDIYCLLKEHK
jgi:PTS system nitrogen regulatory IIA component